MGFTTDEPEDNTVGTTTVVRATATTSWVAYPSSPSTYMSRFNIENDPDNAASRRIWVSLNNAGTDYTALAPGDSMEIQPNNTRQVYIRCATLTTVFSIWYDLSI